MGAKWSSYQAYRTKRKVIKLIHGAGRDQFTHLRSYAQELLNSNQNSIDVIQYSISSNGHVFERIYTCLEACKAGFAMTCMPLIGIEACFLKGDYGSQLMTTIGRDENNQIFPFVYDVLEDETENS